MFLQNCAKKHKPNVFYKNVHKTHFFYKNSHFDKIYFQKNTKKQVFQKTEQKTQVFNKLRKKKRMSKKQNKNMFFFSKNVHKNHESFTKCAEKTFIMGDDIKNSPNIILMPAVALLVQA